MDNITKSWEVTCRVRTLNVLLDISNKMRPSFDLFGNETLVISRRDFEEIRAKYLDGKD